MTRSLYAILNVAPDADPAVIEAAYKALMKKYHPDVLIGAPASAQTRAAEINRAFQILRNPERRAEYDSQEQARQAAVRMSMQGANMRQMNFEPVQPQKRSRWPGWLVIGVIAAALLVYVWQTSAETATGQFASTMPVPTGGTKRRIPQPSSPSESSSPSEPFQPVSAANIDRAIGKARQIHEETGLTGLSAFSEHCFTSRARSAGVTELDFCIAFDSVAAGYDTVSARAQSLPELPRFQPGEMMTRHFAAAERVSEDEEWILERLAQVRSLTAARIESLMTPAPAAAPARQPDKPTKAGGQVKKQASTAQPPRRRKARPTDADFLERQGYIY